MIDPGATDGRLTEIRGLVEKPDGRGRTVEPRLIGRYILQPEVMRMLEARRPAPAAKSS